MILKSLKDYLRMMIGVIYALVMDTFGLILKEDIQNQK